MWDVVVRRELRPVIDALAGKRAGYGEAYARELQRDPCVEYPTAKRERAVCLPPVRAAQAEGLRCAFETGLSPGVHDGPVHREEVPGSRGGALRRRARHPRSEGGTCGRSCTTCSTWRTRPPTTFARRAATPVCHINNQELADFMNALRKDYARLLGPGLAGARHGSLSASRDVLPVEIVRHGRRPEWPVRERPWRVGLTAQLVWVRGSARWGRRSSRGVVRAQANRLVVRLSVSPAGSSVTSGGDASAAQHHLERSAAETGQQRCGSGGRVPSGPRCSPGRDREVTLASVA